ncbi:hypothetical protein D1872_315080 [compost metagenome]
MQKRKEQAVYGPNEGGPPVRVCSALHDFDEIFPGTRSVEFAKVNALPATQQQPPFMNDDRL